MTSFTRETQLVPEVRIQEEEAASQIRLNSSFSVDDISEQQAARGVYSIPGQTEGQDGIERAGWISA